MSTIQYEKLKRRGVHAGYGIVALAAAAGLLGVTRTSVAEKKASGVPLDLHELDLETFMPTIYMGAGLLFLAAGLALIRHAFSPAGCRVS